MKREVRPSDVNRHLMKQFKRGCWDHDLVLQLELKTDKPLDFAEFLLQLRTEEDKRATKLDRMTRHLGDSKGKSSVNIQTVANFSCLTDHNASVLQAYISETENLRKQVAELQMQLNTKKSKRERRREAAALESGLHPPPLRAEAQVHQATPQVTPRAQPKAWFCFR